MIEICPHSCSPHRYEFFPLLVLHLQLVNDQSVEETNRHLSNAYLRIQLLRKQTSNLASHLFLYNRYLGQRHQSQIHDQQQPKKAVDDMLEDNDCFSHDC